MSGTDTFFLIVVWGGLLVALLAALMVGSFSIVGVIIGGLISGLFTFAYFGGRYP